MKLVIRGFVITDRITVKEPKKRVDIARYGAKMSHL
jgi:hypothetical protein